MPIIKSSKKKLRQDKKRTLQNFSVKKIIKTTILDFKRRPTSTALTKVFSALDTAAKKKIYHANKADRLKSRLYKLLKTKSQTVNKPSKIVSKSKSPRKKKSSV